MSSIQAPEQTLFPCEHCSIESTSQSYCEKEMKLEIGSP